MSVASARVSQFSEGTEHDDSMALDDDNAQLVTQIVEAYAADTDAMRELAPPSAEAFSSSQCGDVLAHCWQQIPGC